MHALTNQIADIVSPNDNDIKHYIQQSYSEGYKHNHTANCDKSMKIGTNTYNPVGI